MQRVLSSHICINHRLSVAWLNKVLQAGIPAVEIFMARQHLDYRNRQQVAELGHYFRDSDLTLHSIHLPMYDDEYWGRSGPNAVISITEPVKSKRVVMVDEIKRALEVAEFVPCKYAVQHLGVGEEEYSDFKLEAAFTCLEELTIFARQRGVEILLENIPNRLATAEGLMRFLTFTHMNLNFVFDTGHANLMEGVETAYGIMKERIRSTHVHDNDGQNDRHLVPLLSEGGTIDWPKAMRLLRSRADQYPLLLELREPAGVENPIATAVEAFERLEQLRDDEHD